MYGCTGSAFVRHCTLPFLSKRCKKCSGRENVVYNVVDGQKRESRMKKETLQELFSNKRRLAVVCECGMSFTGGQGYTALES